MSMKCSGGSSMSLGHPVSPTPDPGQPETTLLSQKEAPFFVCRPDSLRLEEVILLAMFTEIIHFS